MITRITPDQSRKMINGSMALLSSLSSIILSSQPIEEKRQFVDLFVHFQPIILEA